MNQSLALIASAAVICGLGTTAWFALKPAPDGTYESCRTIGVTQGIPRDYTDLELVAPDGRTVTLGEVLAPADAPDRLSLIYFGYSFCPDICPLDLQRNAEAVEIAAERGATVRPIFITIDPERDTPERMADFTSLLSPDMVGLTGSEDQIRAAKQRFSAIGDLAQGEDPADPYRIFSHSVFSYLMAPDGEMLATFAGYSAIPDPERQMTADRMADGLACFAGA